MKYNNIPIFCIVGKTGAGKNSISNLILKGTMLENSKYKYPRNLVYGTTRSPRKGEIEGEDYFYYDLKDFDSIKKDVIIESREYNTVDNGRSVYFTTINHIEKAQPASFLVCCASAIQTINYINAGLNVYIIMVDSSAKTRINRYLNRDKVNDKICLEMCRRMIDRTDNEDFDELEKYYTDNNHIIIDNDPKYGDSIISQYIKEKKINISLKIDEFSKLREFIEKSCSK